MAEKFNFSIDQGATFSRAFTILDANNNPVDLSGRTANSQMRKSYTSSTYYQFTSALEANGVITLSMSANTTEAIPAGRYVYDIETTSNTGVITRVLEGIVTVTPQVTK